MTTLRGLLYASKKLIWGGRDLSRFDLAGPHHFATVALLGWRSIKGTLDAG